FTLWQRPTTHRTRLLRGHQFRPTLRAGRSDFLNFTPSSPSVMVFLRVSFPTQTRATSTLSSLIRLLPVVVLRQASTTAPSRRCAHSAFRGLRPTRVLPLGHSSHGSAYISMRRRTTSPEV